MSDLLRDDGVIKYQAIHQNSSPPRHLLLNQLDEVRTMLFDLGLLGAYPDGVGYGNVSIRYETGCIISGTATGAARVLGISGYCYVRNFNLQRNSVLTEGPVNASSEAMTHCAIYKANPQVQCVLHIHNRKLWEDLLSQGCKSTPADIPYGTPQMAQSIAEFVSAADLPDGLLVMAGHEEGIVAYGETTLKAYDQIQALTSF
jgi:ribulose-5-phosphate 4-epimerase/fuculose-1-phosphate aldolase